MTWFRPLRKICVPLTAAALLPVAARAQDAVSGWPGLNVAALSTVYVTDDAGVRTAGRLLRLAPDSLTLLVDGAERRFEARNVRRIDKRGDSLKNGALIGAGAGAAMGLATAGLSDCNSNRGGCPGARAALMLFSTGVYAAVGVAIDALVVGRTPVYIAASRSASAATRAAPAPNGLRASAGLRVAW